MKTRSVRVAKKALAACVLMCAFVTFALGQNTALTFKKGKATVKRNFQPRKRDDAHFYFLKLRKGQTVAIKVASNGVYLSKENECSMFLSLFDGEGKELFLGDSPVGIEDWEGEIEKTGNYKIKVYMNCLEGFTTNDVRKKKPAFRYSLEVQMKR